MKKRNRMMSVKVDVKKICKSDSEINEESPVFEFHKKHNESGNSEINKIMKEHSVEFSSSDEENETVKKARIQSSITNDDSIDENMEEEVSFSMSTEGEESVTKWQAPPSRWQKPASKRLPYTRWSAPPSTSGHNTPPVSSQSCGKRVAVSFFCDNL